MEDITLRALRSLREASLIAAEDTRHTAKLLAAHNIPTPMISCHKFNEAKTTQLITEKISQGQTVALVSDAGFPGISDPGERIIRGCLDLGLHVEILPGPSAVLHALAASGLPMTPFTFDGFIPAKSGQRTKYFSAIAAREHTTVCFESPHRIRKTLTELAAVIPERLICIARELTKKFEESLRGTTQQLAADCATRELRGEITLVIAGKTRQNQYADDHNQIWSPSN